MVIKGREESWVIEVIVVPLPQHEHLVLLFIIFFVYPLFLFLSHITVSKFLIHHHFVLDYTISRQ